MNKQHGFTLIELVMVIVILGILAAVAIPRFVDLRGDAKTAAVQGVAGALSSASAINYAVSNAKAGNGTNVTTCQGASGLLQGGSLPTGYTITSGDAVAAGASQACTISTNDGSNTATASFTAIGVTSGT